MSAHTPGPWLTANAGTRIVSAKGEPLAQVWEDPPGRENARLMAAAPELLAALQRAIDEALADDLDEWFANARAVIAKATGGAA